jgi:hypothetical protein
VLRATGTHTSRYGPRRRQDSQRITSTAHKGSDRLYLRADRHLGRAHCVARTLMTDCLLTDPSSSTSPRINQGPTSGGGRSATRTRAQPGPATGPVEAQPLLKANGEPGGDHEEGEQTPSPRHRHQKHFLYWRAMMHQIGIVCALTLSVIAGGFRMDWDPALGEASSIFLKNHPSALAERGFVTSAIADGVAASTMWGALGRPSCASPPSGLHNLHSTA